LSHVFPSHSRFCDSIFVLSFPICLLPTMNTFQGLL
jgi:hypothetical protein